ncbi:MAG: sensor domain-containing diguanylate cyclase [Candidatus Sedimenticola sp. (ex Thyasira tokunagai)]
MDRGVDRQVQSQPQQAIPPDVVLKEQLHLLNANAFTAITVNLIVSLVFVALMREHVPLSLLTTWLAALCLTVAARGAVATICRRTPLSPRNIHTWARRHIYGAATTGVLWGAAGIIMTYYGTMPHHLMAAFILGGVAAGAMSTTGALPGTYLLFILPMLIPINLTFYLEYYGGGPTEYLVMGGLITLHIVVLLVSFNRYHQLLLRSITLGFNNLQILEKLKQKNSQLNRSEQRMRDITSKLAEGLVVLDRDARVSYMNPEAERLLGWPADKLIGKSLHECIHRDIDGNPIHEGDCAVTKAFKESSVSRIEDDEFIHLDGSRFPVSFIAAPMSENDSEQALVVSFQDITPRKNAEQKLKASERRFQDIAMSSADWIWETDRDGKYTYTSGRVEDILGYRPEELLGKTPFDLMSDKEAKRIQAILNMIFAEKIPIFDLENWNLTKAGQQVCLLTSGIPLLDDDGILVGYRGVAKDITERKKMEAELAHMATYDELTGLLNRHVLNTLLEDEISRSERYNRAFSVFMVDIDYFKAINDTYGHDAGDIILKKLAGHMQQFIRTTDHAARYGGEEFTIILPETPIHSAITLAERLCRDIEAVNFELNGDNGLTVTVSIGVSSFPQHGPDRDSLLIAADKALYNAKETGRNRVSSAADTAVSSPE